MVPQFNEENNEECANHNKEGKETTIRNLPSSTQTPLIKATPPKNFSNIAREITKQSVSPGSMSKPASRTLNFSARPMLEINTSGSCASSISSITASPSNNVMALKRLIDDESNLSAGEETDTLQFLRQLKNVEEEREQLLSIANQNKHLRSLLMNNKLLLEDYTSVNSLPSHEAVSMESNKSNAPITEVKRKRKKGAVRSIIETIEGEKGDDVKAKVLKQVLQHRSIRQIVQRAGFIDAESKEYGSMSSMIGNAKKFLVGLCQQRKPVEDQMTTGGLQSKQYRWQ